MQAGRKERECIALKDKYATAFTVKMKKTWFSGIFRKGASWFI